MSTRVIRDTKALLYGTIIPALRIPRSNDDFTNDSKINALFATCASIKKKQHICVNDISNEINEVVSNLDELSDGSVLIRISPIAFATCYGFSIYDLDNLVSQIVDITHENDQIKTTSIEYIHLLHDILLGKISKDDILVFLPELDILESEIILSKDIRDVLFAALWCFTMTDNYKDAVMKAYKLNGPDNLVLIVTGSISGLYYGINGIPREWINECNRYSSINEFIF